MVKKFKNKYRIQSARLKNYDYSQNGAYFVTICTKSRKHFLGYMTERKIQLSVIGKTANDCWKEILEHFPFIVLGEWVIMPNHVHGVLFIEWELLETKNHQTVETKNFLSLRFEH